MSLLDFFLIIINGAKETYVGWQTESQTKLCYAMHHLKLRKYKYNSESESEHLELKLNFYFKKNKTQSLANIYTRNPDPHCKRRRRRIFSSEPEICQVLISKPGVFIHLISLSSTWQPPGHIATSTTDPGDLHSSSTRSSRMLTAASEPSMPSSVRLDDY